MDSFFDYIETPIGVVTYFWNERGVSFLEVSDDSPTRKSGRAPYFDLSNRLIRYFDGEKVEFDDIAIDTKGLTPFQLGVLMGCRELPYGRTSTYTDLAKYVGDENAKRAVGTALSKNPFPIIVPCHRVKAKNGIGGFSAGDGVGSKMFLLELESGQNYLF